MSKNNNACRYRIYTVSIPYRYPIDTTVTVTVYILFILFILLSILKDSILLTVFFRFIYRIYNVV